MKKPKKLQCTVDDLILAKRFVKLVGSVKQAIEIVDLLALIQKTVKRK